MTDPIVLTRDFFDHLSESWDETSPPQSKQIHTILAACKIEPGCHVLDVACGTGVMIPELMAFGASSVRAIDLSPKMAKRAAEKFRKHENVFVSVADFYKFDERDFDTITAYNAYPHFLDKAGFAAAAKRCLKEGGRLIIAHGDGRDKINSMHKGHGTIQVSSELLSPTDEAHRLTGFRPDLLLDREDIYILSGTFV